MDISIFDGVWRATYNPEGADIIPFATIWVVLKDGYFGGPMAGGGGVFGKIELIDQRQVNLVATASLEYASDGVVFMVPGGHSVEPQQYEGVLKVHEEGTAMSGKVTVAGSDGAVFELPIILVRMNGLGE